MNYRKSEDGSFEVMKNGKWRDVSITVDNMVCLIDENLPRDWEINLDEGSQNLLNDIIETNTFCKEGFEISAGDKFVLSEIYRFVHSTGIGEEEIPSLKEFVKYISDKRELLRDLEGVLKFRENILEWVNKNGCCKE